MTGQPARTPLPGPAQLHLCESDADHARRVRLRCVGLGRGAQFLFGQQRHGLGMRLPILEDLDTLLPRLLLTAADLAEVKHVALEHAAVGHAPVFDEAPVVMRFAVFLPCAAAQEHDGSRSWRFFAPWEQGRSALQPLFALFGQCPA